MTPVRPAPMQPRAVRTLKEVYPVSRLVREAKTVLEGSFPLVWVEGEISNLAMPASGHIYFTLKDEAAQVRCAMFRMRNKQLRFTPENGMQVLMRVRVTLYEGRGEFQLVAEHMEEAGDGALQRAYEALKNRLGQAGLFDEAHKKSLPVLPKAIGVVSSPDGAAVHDILTVLRRRFAGIPVILYPVAVQGAGSATKIAQAITLADARRECDVLIIGRGGGSLEDLWSFNEEAVAQAIFDCEIPIISAVGHEVDFTIADFVADVRAATPSVAAELAVQKDSTEWLTQLSHLCLQLQHPVQQRLQQRQQALDHAVVRLRHPQAQISVQADKLTVLAAQLRRAVIQQQERQAQRLSRYAATLHALRPSSTIQRYQSRVENAMQRLQQGQVTQLAQRQARVGAMQHALQIINPLNTLERGYSITTAENGKVVRQTGAVEQGDMISIRLQSGALSCQVKKVMP